MTAATVERIRRLIQEALGVEEPAPETDLIDSGMLDSLALVSLITEIERDFGFELPLDDFDVENFRSLERMAAFVDSAKPADAA
jgi:D-alanine--poly(phosphoribitol) ligase subunit 2